MLCTLCEIERQDGKPNVLLSFDQSCQSNFPAHVSLHKHAAQMALVEILNESTRFSLRMLWPCAAPDPEGVPELGKGSEVQRAPRLPGQACRWRPGARRRRVEPHPRPPPLSCGGGLVTCHSCGGGCACSGAGRGSSCGLGSSDAIARNICGIAAGGLGCHRCRVGGRAAADAERGPEGRARQAAVLHSGKSREDVALTVPERSRGREASQMRSFENSAATQASSTEDIQLDRCRPELGS